MNILVTGGQGFIGTHLVRALRRNGHGVRTLDLKTGRDVGFPSDVEWGLEGVDTVVHLAAKVSVADSMTRPAVYAQDNVVGTCTLLQGVAKRRGQIRRLVVASSMSVYGEGAPGATSEKWRTAPTSPYGLDKLYQEQACLMMGAAHGFPATALRFFNVYGPGQPVDNPYTGVAAIFAGRVLNGERPVVYDDGMQTRDFVHVSDVVDACVRAVETDDSRIDGETLNIGSGAATTVAALARLVADMLGRPELVPLVTGTHRPGDIRHCVANPGKAAALLDWEAAVPLHTGVADLAGSLRLAA